MAGERVEREQRGVGEEGDVANAGHLRDGGATADVEEDAGACDALVADPERIRRFEAGMATDERDIVHTSDPGFETGARVARHPTCPRHRPCEIDPDRRIDHHAIIRRAPREVGGIGAGDQRLGRHAAGVDAGSAEMMALDQSDFHPRRREPRRQRRTGLAAAHDDGVEDLRAHDEHAIS